MSLLQVILPVIIMLIIGIICREKKLIRPEGIEGFQALVMNFTLPISLFYTFYRASIKADTVIFPVTFFVVTAGGIFSEQLTLISAVIMIILPPPFVLPLYIEETEKKEFYSSAISVYTMLSIVGFMLLSAAVLH